MEAEEGIPRSCWRAWRKSLTRRLQCSARGPMESMEIVLRQGRWLTEKLRLAHGRWVSIQRMRSGGAMRSRFSPSWRMQSQRDRREIIYEICGYCLRNRKSTIWKERFNTEITEDTESTEKRGRTEVRPGTKYLREIPTAVGMAAYCFG